jgi:hypothetical protein
LLLLALHGILAVLGKEYSVQLVLSLREKKKQMLFYLFKIIKALGMKSKLSNSWIDLKKKEKILKKLLACVNK